jgi:hypothetical protein
MLSVLLAAIMGFHPGTLRCSISVHPLTPHPGATYFVVAFSPEMVEVPPGDHPLGMEYGHWSAPDSVTAVYGQIVAVMASGGPGSNTLKRRFFNPRPSTAVLVLWDYDAGCDPTRFGSGGNPWGIPGDTAYIRAILRDSAEWAAGLPTFDIYYAGEGILPFTATFHGHEIHEYLDSIRAESGTPPYVVESLSPRQASSTLTSPTSAQ